MCALYDRVYTLSLHLNNQTLEHNNYDRVYTLSLHLNDQTLEHNNCDKNIDTGGLKYLPHQRHITSAAGCVFVPLIPLLHG